MKNYSIGLYKSDFDNEGLIENYLKDRGIKYTKEEGDISKFFNIKVKNRTWRSIQRDLKLQMVGVY